MSDKDSKALGKPFRLLENGVIKIARTFENPLAPYEQVGKGEIPDYLAAVDHTVKIDKKKDYERQMNAEEERFNKLVRRMAAKRKFLVVVLQGRDGAGKSGATQRVAGALDFDAKLFLSVPIGAPTEDERAHPPLWRFFKDDRMPAYGQVRVFDRSWFEEVLVVRVNELQPPAVWQHTYAGLRAMDWSLEQQGGVVVKLWLDITKGEQKKRFEDRARDKPWKLSPSDAEARKKWKKYTRAANEMFFRTGTDYAPWFIVSSEDKRYSRVNVLRIINQQLEEALGPESDDKGKDEKKNKEKKEQG